MKRKRKATEYLAVAGIVLLALGLLAGLNLWRLRVQPDRYYIMSNQIFAVSQSGNRRVAWDETLTLTGLAWDGDSLCASAEDAEGNSGLYVSDGEDWTRLEGCVPQGQQALAMEGDYIYFLSGESSAVARIRTDGSKLETLPVSHDPEKYGAFCLSDGQLYTLSEGQTRCWLTVYDMTSRTVSKAAMPETGTLRLSRGWVYHIAEDDGTVTISRIQGTLLPWKQLSAISIQTADYDDWNENLLAFWGKNVLYETADGKLMRYDGASAACLPLPQSQNSTESAPDYYFGEKGFTVVYHTADGDAAEDYWS